MTRPLTFQKMGNKVQSTDNLDNKIRKKLVIVGDVMDFKIGSSWKNCIIDGSSKRGISRAVLTDNI